MSDEVLIADSKRSTSAEGFSSDKARVGGYPSSHFVRDPDVDDEDTGVCIAARIWLCSACVTAPRCILPGTTRLLTRRCTQRQFLLRPSATTNQLIGYAYAVAADKTGMQLHALCAMGNHVHVVCTDPADELPAFWREAHRLIAKSVNCHLGRWENLWASEKPSAVELVEDIDVLDKMIYTMANPVEAGLVAHGRSWPGLRMMFGQRPHVIARPRVYYDPSGSMPESVTLQMVRPPIAEGASDADLAARIAEMVERREAEIRARFAATGRRFLGRRAVLAQSPFDSPTTREPRRNLSPRVAAKNKWKRIETLQRNRDFEAAHESARLRWCAGDRDVVFPAGTYWWRVVAGVDTAPPPG